MVTLFEKYFEVHGEGEAPKLFEILQELNDGVASVVKERSDNIERHIDQGFNLLLQRIKLQDSKESSISQTLKTLEA
jgi:hypothetical protein